MSETKTPPAAAPERVPLPPPARSLGYPLIAWVEHYLVHGPGDVQGTPIVLDVELASFLVRAYEVDDGGVRVFREAFFSRSKGRAKSELAGMLVCAEFIGPVRYSHAATADEPPMVCPVCQVVVYEFGPGDAVGQAVTYPFIRCMATEEGQAGNTYDNVSTMLWDVRDRHAAAFPTLDIGQKAQSSTRIFRGDGGEIRPSTASSSSKDGGKESFVVYDESHLYNTPELRRMYDTTKRNLVKRRAAQPWALQTSTMYAIGEDSVAEATHKFSRRARSAGLLFDHVEAPEHLSPERKADRIAGLRHCYGPAAAWMPVETIAEEWNDPRVDRSDWLRYFWNRAVAGVSDLVNAAEWDAAARPELALAPSDAICLGFDGGRSDDSTALVACRLSDGFLSVVRIWERPSAAGLDPAAGPTGWRVPREDVDAVVRAAFDAYDVVQMWADPNRWEPYLDAWGAAFPKRVAEEWPTDRGTDKAVRLFLAALKDGSLTHDGDPVLRRHVTNATLVRGRNRPATETGEDSDPLARSYLSIRKKATGKIDAAWAASLALKARGWCLEKGMTGGRVDPSQFVF